MGQVTYFPKAAQEVSTLITFYSIILMLGNGIFDSSDPFYVPRLFLQFAFASSCVFTFFKSLMVCHDKIRKTGNREKYRRDYLTGCFGMILAIYTAFIYMCYNQFQLLTSSFLFFACNYISILFYLTFIRDCESKCRVRPVKGHLIAMIALFHVIGLITTYNLLILRGFPHYGGVLLAIQVMYSFELTLLIPTFFAVLMNRIEIPIKSTVIKTGEVGTMRELRSFDGDGVSYTSVDETGESALMSETGAECEICMVKYDRAVEKHTPRILIKCGHTMCQGCIGNLLEYNSHQDVCCPFCQQVTVVNGGSASYLPKNYGMLKLIR
ncbi:hypothetical protein GCK72_013562 [Caenorhabditis remanei]|uniref:RING-type domain-containing protein n=1 Tax=Caenorhabditis remanei TaxID=31234 RepID=A0A6A5GPJ8_CAERE|nr:hypothetical protein GCK72_013562 [Caenorhabditis remanei]KAF1757107.1 hypothetical protein GCK72_013562 [Caenorhabditis remanei]